MTALLPALATLLLAAPQPPAAASERDRAMGRASQALAAGDRAEAERLLGATAERFHSVKALIELARVQAGGGEGASALATLEKALRLAPNSEEVLRAYAQVCLTGHAPVPAILALEPLARLWPTVAEYHYLLGVALMQAGDMPAATESLQQAEQLDPDRALTLVALGLALNERKLYAQAKPKLERSLELAPDSLEAVAALAEAEQGLGDLGQAESHARRVLESQPRNATANLVMGMVLMERERYAEAREALEKAAAAAPESPKVHYQLSLACARVGDQAASERQVALYKQTLQQSKDRLAALRDKTGISSGGMHQ